MPLRIPRRGFLGAAAATGVAAGTVGLAGCTTDTAPAAAKGEAFRGSHQMGILPDPRPYAVLAAFSCVAADRAELAACLEAVSESIETLTTSVLPAPTDLAAPPADNSILLGTDARLTSGTVSVGASLFDDRYGLADRRPPALVTMPNRLANDRLDRDRCDGDLLVVLQGDHIDVPVHALRILMRATRKWLVLKWVQDAFNRPDTTASPGTVSTRNLLGFKDGTANPDAGKADTMDEVVWTRTGEVPAWAVGGSYQVVRAIRMFVEQWDRASLGGPEKIIGREKVSGAPLGMAKESDVPAYAEDPGGTAVPLDAHIRLANPRTAGTRLMLRRGMSYSRGVDGAGLLDQGLLFVSYQRTLAAFLEAQQRMKGEPLEEYIQANGGGFYYALPGPASGEYLGQRLVTP